MPILASDIEKRMRPKLDAEGSDRYLFDQDIKPAINSAIDTIVTMCNMAFADNKLSPEALRELVKVKIWQTSSYSRFYYNSADTSHVLWTVLAIYPKPTVNKGISSSTATTKDQSKFRDDLSFIKSEHSAKRLTFEEWNENSKNVFMPGNNLLQGALAEYSYLDMADYTSKSYDNVSGKTEFEIRPGIPNELVALAYLKRPTEINLSSDSVEFPDSLKELIAEIALNYISFKEGQTPLYQITVQGINTLIGLIK
jgi:hypothetical protein